MRRRDYLIGSAVTLTSLAGCGGPGPGVNETDGSPGGASPIGTATEPGTEPPTETAMGTPTEAETPTPMETETPTATATETETATPTATDTGSSMSIEMVSEDDENFFDPVGLAVEPGTTVEWTVRAGDHSSTAYEDRVPEAAEPWDSGVLTEDGATFSHTFEAEGTYDYFCEPHRTLGMVARIVVGEPGGPAEGSMPPDGDVPESARIVEEGSVSHEAFASGS